jgi:hypothetical protein
VVGHGDRQSRRLVRRCKCGRRLRLPSVVSGRPDPHHRDVLLHRRRGSARVLVVLHVVRVLHAHVLVASHLRHRLVVLGVGIHVVVVHVVLVLQVVMLLAIVVVIAMARAASITPSSPPRPTTATTSPARVASHVSMAAGNNHIAAHWHGHADSSARILPSRQIELTVVHPAGLRGLHSERWGCVTAYGERCGDRTL